MSAVYENIKCRFVTMFSPLRSIHRLTQLERLDLGSNEFSDVVRLIAAMFSKFMLKCSINCLTLQSSFVITGS